LVEGVPVLWGTPFAVLVVAPTRGKGWLRRATRWCILSLQACLRVAPDSLHA